MKIKDLAFQQVVGNNSCHLVRANVKLSQARQASQEFMVELSMELVASQKETSKGWDTVKELGVAGELVTLQGQFRQACHGGEAGWNPSSELVVSKRQKLHMAQLIDPFGDCVSLGFESCEMD